MSLLTVTIYYHHIYIGDYGKMNNLEMKVVYKDEFGNLSYGSTYDYQKGESLKSILYNITTPAKKEFLGLELSNKKEFKNDVNLSNFNPKALLFHGVKLFLFMDIYQKEINTYRMPYTHGLLVSFHDHINNEYGKKAKVGKKMTKLIVEDTPLIIISKTSFKLVSNESYFPILNDKIKFEMVLSVLDRHIYNPIARITC